MDYLVKYQSPLGGITLASDGEYLVGLWFDGQKNCGSALCTKGTMSRRRMKTAAHSLGSGFEQALTSRLREHTASLYLDGCKKGTMSGVQDAENDSLPGETSHCTMGTMSDLRVLELAAKWLDVYFSGEVPDFMPPIKFRGTDFQKSVWETLLTIPYGETVTYGDIAKNIAEQRGVTKMSSQAVGGAVGRNPIGIIVPCHRVIGANGKLTGYAAGLDKKVKLLELESAQRGR